MQLKLKRSQRQGGVMGGKLLFCLDARAEFTGEERFNITKYKLGSLCIYNSEAAKQHIANADGNIASGSFTGSLKALGSLALAKLNLNITIDDLERGKHIECKDMDELLGAEQAVVTACQNLRAYLGAAATFDGREVLIDFSDEEPMLAAPSASALAPPPASAIPTIPLMAMSSGQPTTATAPAMAGSSSVMMPSRTFEDEIPPIEKTKVWWGSLTGQQKAIYIGVAFVVLYILVKIV